MGMFYVSKSEPEDPNDKIPDEIVEKVAKSLFLQKPQGAILGRDIQKWDNLTEEQLNPLRSAARGLIGGVMGDIRGWLADELKEKSENQKLSYSFRQGIAYSSDYLKGGF